MAEAGSVVAGLGEAGSAAATTAVAGWEEAEWGHYTQLCFGEGTCVSAKTRATHRRPHPMYWYTTLPSATYTLPFTSTAMLDGLLRLHATVTSDMYGKHRVYRQLVPLSTTYNPSTASNATALGWLNVDWKLRQRRTCASGC